MALDPTDPKPDDIPLADAYAAIYQWYRENVLLVAQATSDTDYARASVFLIAHLPIPQVATDLERRAVLSDIVNGYLEWAYHRDDGRFKMGAYAHAALGDRWLLTEDDRAKTLSSSIGAYLFANRNGLMAQMHRHRTQRQST